VPRLRDVGVRPGTKKPSGRPFQKGHKKVGGRRKGTPNKVPQEVKNLLQSVLEDPEYQSSLRERMIAGRAPQLEALAFHYAVGKPRETVKVEDDSSLAAILARAASRGLGNETRMKPRRRRDT
jgi:hypothetical protein